MSEIIDPDESLPTSTNLSRPAAGLGDSEVMLRNRDVQALSRSFRRMSEVQEALLEHLDQIEEARGRTWVMPFMAVSCLVLGAGMATLGLLFFQGNQEPMEVQLEQPEITIEPPVVTVTAPASELDATMLQELLERISQIDAAREEDRKRIVELQGQLADGELALVDAMRELREMDRLRAESASAVTPQPADLSEAESTEELSEEEIQALATAEAEEQALAAAEEEHEAWLGAMNGLMVASGHPEFRFQSGDRVEGEPKLEDVIFFIWGDDGIVDSVVQAGRVEFRLQQSTYTLEIQFFDGTRTRSQRKTTLSGGGLSLVLPDVDVPAWLAHFPELADGKPVLTELDAESVVSSPAAADLAEQGGDEGEPATEQLAKPVALSAEELESLRLGVDGLLSPPRASGYYRLNRVQGVSGDSLLGVQLAWYNARGELFRYIEADQLQLFTRGDGWLELRFENGSFRSQGKKTPFQGGKYRLHLPDQDLSAWRATGVPVQQARP